MKRRVVITGMGAVTSLGMGAQLLWQAVKNGKSGISRIERIDVEDFPTKVAAEIKDFEPGLYMDGTRKFRNTGWSNRKGTDRCDSRLRDWWLRDLGKSA